MDVLHVSPFVLAFIPSLQLTEHLKHQGLKDEFCFGKASCQVRTVSFNEGSNIGDPYQLSFVTSTRKGPLFQLNMGNIFIHIQMYIRESFIKINISKLHLSIRGTRDDLPLSVSALRASL